MPVGPLALTDEVSLELVYKVAKQTQADLGATYIEPPSAPVAKLMVEKLGRLGRKVSKGFYDYPAEGGKRLWPGLAEHFPPRAEQPAVEEIVERLILIQSVETTRCLAEKVLNRPLDADVGAILGWGYPPFRGGPIGWIHTLGIEQFLAACERLAARCGPRFAPPPFLKEMAAKGESFYKN
jgi:3-hydroxyacyl-CoA dehydrogenase/enoyl-CoA hydratase/3-hydroxybutyryl-CoA epimerase